MNPFLQNEPIRNLCPFQSLIYLKKVELIPQNLLKSVIIYALNFVWWRIIMDFAVSVLKLTNNIKEHFSLTNQLKGSATSIDANIR